MKSALFIDFDNVYSCLKQLDPTYAERFAQQPAAWLSWLVDALQLPDGAPVHTKRRVLVRRCYLNPQVYQQFRARFNMAGFEIVDCPALTSGGKTSTDIHMVLDIVDLLQHETHYDEFIVFSADADFTPVLRRLRRWDRRTTVLAVGFPSAAYRASADLLINPDDFIRYGLGIDDEQEPAPATSQPSSGAIDMAIELVKREVGNAPSPVPIARLAAQILHSIDSIDAATWAGHGNFRSFLESLPLAPLTICWTQGGYIQDPARHQDAPAKPQPAQVAMDIGAAVEDLIKSHLQHTQRNISCAHMANLIIQKYPQLATDWNGHGTFRKFSEALDIEPFTFEWNASGGRLLAVDSGSADTLPPEGWETAQYPHLYATVSRIHEATDIPLLPPAKYRLLLSLLSRDVASHPFNLVETSKRLRDASKEAALPISRSAIQHVLRGILFRGHAFERGPNDPSTLQQKLTDNIRSLCLREQIILDTETEAAIQAWIPATD